MNKKYFVLMMLSLALYNQSGFAAEVVDSQNQNISIEQKNNTKLKQFVQTKGPVKVNRPLNVRPKILTLRRSVFLWQNIVLYLN